MASTPLILNEWVIHDLRGDNGEQCQTEAFQFLSQVEAKCDHLVLLRGSPWMEKAYDLMRESYLNLKIRLISKFLQTSFILNPLKSATFDPEEIPHTATRTEAAGIR